MDHETAGDPVRGLKWTRRTTAKVAAQLRKLGTDICARTVARLLKKMGFSLRVNHKKRAGASHPNRDDQFHHIAELRERCAADNTPVISVDTKKKELVGAFRNPGAKWDRRPELVNDHDFRSDADGLAIPYGIYDTRANAGTVFVGQTADTPAFAVDCIEKWWRTEGCKHYPEAEALQILADGGGSNSCTARAWKFNLQHRLCNRHGLRVRVAHYPPATSKWNPIEHRMFCEVTKNWAGRPLDSYESILKYLRTTRTATGLRVRAPPGPQDLQDRRQGHRRADAGVTHHTRQLPAQMELHHRTHVTKKRKLFLRGAIVRRRMVERVVDVRGLRDIGAKSADPDRFLTPVSVTSSRIWPSRVWTTGRPTIAPSSQNTASIPGRPDRSSTGIRSTTTTPGPSSRRRRTSSSRLRHASSS